jgi:hypothetical protein
VPALVVCNDVDDDCDGLVVDDDEDVADATTWYRDGDGDGDGDPYSSLVACEAPAGHVAAHSDCDDADPAVHGCLFTDCAAILAANPSAPSGRWSIDPDGDGETVEVTCDMDSEGGGWNVLADLDFSTDPCPGMWVPDRTEGVCRAAIPSWGGTSSATFDALGVSWSEVLVEVCLRQNGTPDAFGSSVEFCSLDGLSLTHGPAGSRHHLFAWAVACDTHFSVAYALCPADGGTSPPSFVGSDWACDTGSRTRICDEYYGVWLPPRLFEGTVRHLTVAGVTTDDLEARLCLDQNMGDEDLGVCAIRIEVR